MDQPASTSTSAYMSLETLSPQGWGQASFVSKKAKVTTNLKCGGEGAVMGEAEDAAQPEECSPGMKLRVPYPALTLKDQNFIPSSATL